MPTRRDYVDRFLTRLAYHDTADNVAAVLTWIRSEFGGASPIPAAWNPQATTYDLAPNTRYNSVGVRNYETFSQGVEANAHTLGFDAPGYAAIRASLAAGDNATRTVDAIHASAWGSKPTPELLAYVRAHEAADAALSVGAGSVEPTPPGGNPVPAWPGVLLRDPTVDHGTAAWQGQMRHRGWAIVVDDRYGPASARACRAFQAEKGLVVDGIVGPVTWAATWTAPVTR